MNPRNPQPQGDADVRTAAVTVAVCTLNRLALLRRAVAAVRAQLDEFPRGQLLIVDNGSQDGTIDYLAELAASDPRVTVMHERRLGIYHARATAIQAARGDFIVFLDDDAIPDPGWLVAILRPLVREPDVGVSSGTSRPLWLAPRPDWMPDRFLDEFSIIPTAGRRVLCGFPYFPPALGMAIRRHPCLALFSHPRRRELALGPRTTDATRPIYRGEDTDLCEIYLRNGFKVIVEDEPSVAHAIHADRLTHDWLLRKFRLEGHVRIHMCRLLGLPVVCRHTWKLLAAWPVLLGLRLLAPVLNPRTRILWRAYYEKSTGAWLEALFGPRDAALPFGLDEASGAQSRA